MAKQKKAKHPVSGLTETQEIQRSKAALRREWRRTTRARHIKSVRFDHPDEDSRFRFAVKCNGCGRVMGQSEFESFTTIGGKRRRRSAYEVNHICDEGMPKVANLEEDLGMFAAAMFRTPVEILCRECHSGVTTEQMKQRYKK